MNDDEYKKWLREKVRGARARGGQLGDRIRHVDLGLESIAMIAVPVTKFLIFLILNEPKSEHPRAPCHRLARLCTITG